MFITRTLLFLAVMLLLLAGLSVLQVFLSKKEKAWPGLILPAVSFLFSLIYPLSMMVPPEGVTAAYLGQMLLVWGLGNIPTVIFLLIYGCCRGNRRRKKQLDKMNIQDL